MLLAEALVRLLELWDNEKLKFLSRRLVRGRILVVLVQISNRTLLSQRLSGAWGPNDSHEVTAYAILTLTSVSSLPFIRVQQTEIASSIQAGRQFLGENRHLWPEPQYIWIEKVTYGSTILSEAYCLAAMNPWMPSYIWSESTVNLEIVSPTVLSKMSQFFLRLPKFSNEPDWRLRASILEGHAFLPQLKEAQSDIFPAQENAKDEYLKYIPCTWTITNNYRGIFLHATLLWDMMVMSMFDFLVDEYMESVVPQLSEDKLESLERFVQQICDSPKAERNGKRKRHVSEEAEALDRVLITSSDALEAEQIRNFVAIKSVLGRYIKYICGHPRVAQASSNDQSTLQYELRNFLFAHLIQLRDNARFCGQHFPSEDTTTIFLTPRTPYYSWTHTTAADHISCPVSFAFYTCLLRSPGDHRDCFPSVREKYIAQDLCSHLAIMSRLYNDYASIPRDREERNINSVNFPEFHADQSNYASVEEKESKLKAELLNLARYERNCVGTVVQALIENPSDSSRKENRVAEAIRLFVSVTELYADMYVARDLTNRTK